MLHCHFATFGSYPQSQEGNLRWRPKIPADLHHNSPPQSTTLVSRDPRHIPGLSDRQCFLKKSPTKPLTQPM
jgi:hypothetical protein